MQFISLSLLIFRMVSRISHHSLLSLSVISGWSHVGGLNWFMGSLNMERRGQRTRGVHMPLALSSHFFIFCPAFAFLHLQASFWLADKRNSLKQSNANESRRVKRGLQVVVTIYSFDLLNLAHVQIEINKRVKF